MIGNTLQSIIEMRGPIRNIGVVGMGYVGIPAAALFADVPEVDVVWGFQRDSATSGYKIAMLNRGESPLKGKEPGLEELLESVVTMGKFRCTSDFTEIAECDAVTLAIQTPFKDTKELVPDFSALTEALHAVGRYLSKGTLVVLESTVTPGTTVGMARAILESESGLIAGEEFALAHAPERVMVGRLLKNIREYDRIIGGIDDFSASRAAELYRPVLTTGKIIPMTATAAEVTKTAENAFRDVQIATVNQLALHCDAMGVNVYDVRAGIDSLKGEGVTRAALWPGAGVGGHCLTKDSWHLERGAQVFGHDDLWYPHGADSIFGVARAINDFMPQYMAHLTFEGFNRTGRYPRNKTIALLGWAFVQNSDDARNTPAEPYRTTMMKMGATVKVHDPFVEQYPGVEISHDLDAVLTDADAIVIFTAHDQYYALEPEHIKYLSGKNVPVIIDGRNIIDPDWYIQTGFAYKGIGRGDKNNHEIVL